MLKKFCLIIFIVLLVIFSITIMKTKKEHNTVTFLTLQLNTLEPYMNKVITKFENQNPNVKIKWIDVPYSEGEKRIFASLLSNSMPDLINITSDFAENLAEKNALYIINSEQTKDYNKNIMNILTTKDGYNSFPFYATSAITFYNTELLAEGGIKTVPKTYTELNEITPNFHKKTGKYAQMPTLCENDTFLKILNKNGITTPDKFNSEQARNILEQYKYFYVNNFIPQESITQTHREVLEKFGANQIAFLQAGANFLNIIKENSPQVYKNTNVSYQIKTDNSGYDFSLMTIAIPKRAKNKDTAIKFAQFLLNEENQLEFAKLTAILPVNQKTLENEYFTQFDENDLISKARVVSAKQLNYLQTPVKFKKHKREIIDLTNSAVQTVLLNKETTDKVIKDTANKWKYLEND